MLALSLRATTEPLLAEILDAWFEAEPGREAGDRENVARVGEIGGIQPAPGYSARSSSTSKRRRGRPSSPSPRDHGDWVVARVRLSATSRSSGIPVERVTWNAYELRDGKIASDRVFMTEQDALEAVGREG